jgi:hypothetical protein
MQENNILYKRVNRFSANVGFEKEEYNLFEFNGNLKSDKIESLEFTNYLSSDKCKKYFLLLEICKAINNKYSNINKYFIADEFDSHRYNAKRVYDIIEAVNNKIIDKSVVVYKFKCKKDAAIQFYVIKEDKILKLCLIDIYHIVIEATNKKIGKADRKGIYEARKKCSFNIRELQKELNKVSDKR